MISSPAFSDGALAPRSAFNVIILSPIFKVAVLIYVVVPETVKLPVIVTLFAVNNPVNVGLANGANVELTYVLDAA